jgi:hypothetical protein
MARLRRPGESSVGFGRGSGQEDAGPRSTCRSAHRCALSARCGSLIRQDRNRTAKLTNARYERHRHAVLASVSAARAAESGRTPHPRARLRTRPTTAKKMPGPTSTTAPHTGVLSPRAADRSTGEIPTELQSSPTRATRDTGTLRSLLCLRQGPRKPGEHSLGFGREGGCPRARYQAATPGQEDTTPIARHRFAYIAVRTACKSLGSALRNPAYDYESFDRRPQGLIWTFR